MRILPFIEEQIRRVIRDARAKDPLISVAGLKDICEQHFDRGFSHQYISKLADKVAREALVTADRTKIEERLSFTRDNYRMMREELLKIVYWSEGGALPMPRAQDRIEAAKSVVMMDLALLTAEIANGMYKKSIDAIAKEIRYDPLPDEIRVAIVASWKRGGLLPAETVEKMVPQSLTH
jgi:hypothetical protein